MLYIINNVINWYAWQSIKHGTLVEVLWLQKEVCARAQTHSYPWAKFNEFSGRSGWGHSISSKCPLGVSIHLVGLNVGFPGGAVVKNSLANAGDTEDLSLILSGEDPLEKEMLTHSSILVWESPWTEEPGGLQSMRSHTELDMSRHSFTHNGLFSLR